MPQVAATANIDYMNRKQVRQLARIYGVTHDNGTTTAALVAAVKAK